MPIIPENLGNIMNRFNPLATDDSHNHKIQSSGSATRQIRGTYTSTHNTHNNDTYESNGNGTKHVEDRRAELRRIAEETLIILQKGYTFRGMDYSLEKHVLEAKENTKFYAAEEPSLLSWSSPRSKRRVPSSAPAAHVSVLQISTLDGARLLENVYKNNEHERGNGTGVLNFASAMKPGGGFKNGAEAQEESIARSSTLYPTLMHTPEAAKFYDLHNEMQYRNREDSQSYYSHAIIYSPGIVVFRDDDGAVTYPFTIDVLSCAAVNAGEVRKASHSPVTSGLEVEIEKVMTERMGRILYVFEQRGIRNLVLGTFGTGVFRNNIGLVARLWANLLVVAEARFQYSFDRIIFAITGEQTFAEFQSAFDAWRPKPAPALSNWGPRYGNLVQL